MGNLPERYQNIYESLACIVFDRTGLRLDDNRWHMIDHIVRELYPIEINRLPATLTVEPITSPLWRYVINAVTIGETYFYRNQSHFIALRERILPDLIAMRRESGQKYLRIWSAGCATGEEPYSIAMLLYELLPDIHDWLITILGTDINEISLELARRGQYSSNAFRKETPPQVTARWFTKNGRYLELSPEIRQRVTFRPLNLIETTYPSYDNNTMNMDIVLCRNVTIYFTREQTIEVVGRLYHAISNGGWLIVGHSEPQSGVYNAFQTHHVSGAVFYRKPYPAFDDRADRPAPTLPPILPEKPARIAPSVEPRPVLKAADVLHSAKQAADQESWEVALGLLNSIRHDDTLQPQVYYLRGVIEHAQGHDAQAIESLRKAIYCDPAFGLAHYMIGDLYDQTGSPVLALRHWRRGLDALRGLDSHTVIPLEDDLTVEMLQGLLNYRIQTHPENQKG